MTVTMLTGDCRAMLEQFHPNARIVARPSTADHRDFMPCLREEARMLRHDSLDAADDRSVRVVHEGYCHRVALAYAVLGQQA